MAQPLKAPCVGKISPPRRSAPSPSPRPRPNRLWIAIHLPAFPLEALVRRVHQPHQPSGTATGTLAAAAHARAAAVVESQKGHLRIVVANDAALDRGVSPGLKLSAAQALHPALAVLNRSAEIEHRELVSLACWVRRITPLVSLEPPHAVLLEVGGSLRLWGGLDSIRQALVKELGTRRLTAHLCAAPTALAALWLARGGQEDALSGRQLAGRLGVLPLRVTGWPRTARLKLRKMGIVTVGDCLRLPRDGLVRRVGRRCLDDLDKSLGGEDIRVAFRPDRRFSSIVEFEEEVTEPEVIAEVGQKLILRLAEALHRHQVQISSCRYGFHHLRQPATVKRIDLVVPTYESKRIIDLFRTQLETLSLPVPVIALSLKTGKCEPMKGLNSTLFPAGPDRVSGWPATTASTVGTATATGPDGACSPGELIARLRTRFGAEDIHGLELAEDHRPEVAWSKLKDPGAGTVAAVAAAAGGVPGDAGGVPAAASEGVERPLWLLPAPVSVAVADGGRKHLRLESGPERIEAGWWEGLDASRDYYIARGSQGKRMWVFQDRCSDRGDWYLHGIFG